MSLFNTNAAPGELGTTALALGRALAGPLKAALAESPGLLSDPDALARRLAPVLSRELAATFSAAPRAAAEETDSDIALDGSAKARVLAAIARHPAGRSPGLTPDAVAALTGLSPGLLGDTVSALVQAGDLVRDAWLIRLPETGDLLPQARIPSTAVADEVEVERLGGERRAIGDRRRLGERRLYERRGP
jgi:hypothetical protein